MTPPIVPEDPSVLRDEELQALIKACDGSDFEWRRDSAIIRLLLDTGMRRSQLTGLKLRDIDFEHDVAVVMGKGRRPRACPFVNKPAKALDRSQVGQFAGRVGLPQTETGRATCAAEQSTGTRREGDLLHH